MAPATLMNRNLEEDFERDIEALIREQHQSRAAFDLDRDELNTYRSGSAPPTVEGSRTAFRSMFGQPGVIVDSAPLGGSHGVGGGGGGGALSEEEMRSHPAYASYYYSNENLNPRMPPPAVSKEDWRARQRAAGASLFGKIGDRRRKESVDNGNDSSLFSFQPGEREMLDKNLPQQQSGEWLDRSADGLIGLPDVPLGTRRKSFADALQGEFSHQTFGAENLSRPSSRNTYDNVNLARLSDPQPMQLHNVSEALGDFEPEGASLLVRAQSIGSSISNSFASVLGSSISRSKTPDAQLVKRSPSPCLPSVGASYNDSDKIRSVASNGLASAPFFMVQPGDVAASMSSLSLSKNSSLDGENHVHHRLSKEFSDQPELLSYVPSDQRHLQNKVFDNFKTKPSRSQPTHFTGYNHISKISDSLADSSLPKLTSNGQISLPKQPSYANTYKNIPSEVTSSVGSNGHLLNADSSDINFGESNLNIRTGSYGLPVALNNQLDSDGHNMNGNGNQVGSGLQLPVTDSTYGQYLRGASHTLVHGATSLDPSLGRNYLGASQLDLPGYQSSYLGELLVHQKMQYGLPYLSKSHSLSHSLYGNHAYGVGITYPANPVTSIIQSPFGSYTPVRSNEHLHRVQFTSRSAVGDSGGSWTLGNGSVEEVYASSLLEEFKNNKNRSFELLDIVGHVVEFSADQYGSRFIQQKLETASVEEKNKIFPEILPRAHSLMTDVFGNYVIQKFFEHGTEVQRKQLASQLTGHVLPLSLQMYGCRVIQKALEVVGVDQQTKMALELDGHIMKCVRDQNGNHVIQKCIECVPQEKIQFIIEVFYGQVIALSTHPYGCRVIQRVLEHSDNANTQKIIMDEILQSVCTLAQDQYGNYVIQHVLRHGKPEERSAIVSKLAGQIVKLSHQKYASNVIEKCLTYGTPEERQILITEMLGSTDENEPLQAMMKDQFANYVVQKVIETCDDQNRELILSRIKVHLNALKRYTYGKHIVTRVEKLVAAGEKRIGASSYYS